MGDHASIYGYWKKSLVIICTDRFEKQSEKLKSPYKFSETI